MSNLKKDIEGVLAEFGRTCSPVATLRKVDNPLVTPKNIDNATTQIINLIESVIDEIIGENELERITPNIAASRRGKTYSDGIAILRNKLRKEQRDIKSKLIDGDE